MNPSRRTTARPPVLAPPLRDREEPVLTDLSLLHPCFRVPLVNLLERIHQLHPNRQIRVIETSRSPIRQRRLYASGASSCPPWRSHHQYGLAADLQLPGDLTGQIAADILDLCDQYDLEAQPRTQALIHVQYPIGLDNLLCARYPGSGDETWWTNLQRFAKMDDKAN